jgi:hypothetical protein
MGLAEEKLKLKYKENTDKYSKSMGSKGFEILYVPQWDTFSGLNQKMVSAAEGASSHLHMWLQNLSINLDHPASKMTWDALKSAINGFVPVHSDKMKGLEYSLEIKDKKLMITANMNEFVISTNSKEQKPFKQYVESLI